MKRIVDEQLQQQMNITGQYIRRAREKAKLTQKEISIKLETLAVYVCRGSLSRIENGWRIVTDIELQAIADILHISIDSLFTGDL